MDATTSGAAPGPLVVPDRRTMLRSFPKWSVGAEIGVFKGEFSEVIVEEVNPEVLYLVDHWTCLLQWGLLSEDGRQRIMNGEEAYREARDRFQYRIIAGQVRLLHGPAERWLPLLPPLDWIYVDTEHTYEGTLRQLQLCWPVVRDGGWIAGHDYCPTFPGVVQAVDEFCRLRQQRVAIIATEPACPRFNAAGQHEGDVSYSSFAIEVKHV